MLPTLLHKNHKTFSVDSTMQCRHFKLYIVTEQSFLYCIVFYSKFVFRVIQMAAVSQVLSPPLSTIVTQSFKGAQKAPSAKLVPTFAHFCHALSRKVRNQADSIVVVPRTLIRVQSQNTGTNHTFNVKSELAELESMQVPN